MLNTHRPKGLHTMRIFYSIEVKLNGIWEPAYVCHTLEEATRRTSGWVPPWRITADEATDLADDDSIDLSHMDCNEEE